MSESLDFLGLPGIRTTARRQTEQGLEVEAETVEPFFPTVCCLDQSLAPDGARPVRRVINDTPHGGFATAILMKVKRARCKSCGRKGMIEKLPGVHHTRHMTNRLYEHIARECLIRTNTRLGFEVGVTEGTARAILREFVDDQLRERKIETPRVLGLDEKMLLGDYRCVICNMEEKTVIDLLPNRDHALRAFCEAMPDKHKVEVVVADMYGAFHKMQKDHFPQALHVYDRFHVVRRANEAMDKIRASVAKAAEPFDRKVLSQSKRLFLQRARDLTDGGHHRIKTWSQRFPILGEAYWAKERYFDMYECRTPADAEAHYRRWVKTLPIQIQPTFLKLCRISAGQQARAVFAYFDEPYTTGYIEGVNRMLDDIQRAGRGYSYDIIRGKLLLTPKLQKRTFRDRQPNMFVPEEDRLPPIIIELGLDTEELSGLLNDGWLHHDEDGRAWIRTGETTIRALGREII